MSVEKWIAGSGVGLTWTSIDGSSQLDSLASGNAIQMDAITNGTALDIFADVSIALGSAAFAAPNTVGIYLFPLDQDGSVYGSGSFASAAAGPVASMPITVRAARRCLRCIVSPPRLSVLALETDEPVFGFTPIFPTHVDELD